MARMWPNLNYTYNINTIVKQESIRKITADYILILSGSLVYILFMFVRKLEQSKHFYVTKYWGVVISCIALDLSVLQANM